MSSATLEIALLILVTTAVLLVVVSRRRSARTSVQKHKLRITEKDGKRTVVLDGVEITNPESVEDPALRQALARAEKVLSQVDRSPIKVELKEQKG
jgi:Flp pilus assembly protein CpaB